MKIISSVSGFIPQETTIGGKAENLFRLLGEDFAVPPFLVIPAEEMPSAENKESLIGAIGSFRFPEAFQEKIKTMLPGKFYAVRSSAAGEDGSRQSFAGQFESFLFVSKEQIEASIRKVWLSALSGRVEMYSSDKNGIPRMAVIIQTMIDAEISGVAFSINPATGNRNEQVISAVYGCGEGIVSGALNADNYFVRGENITVRAAEKTSRFVFDSESGNGTKEIPLSAEQQNKTTLNSRQALAIAGLLRKLKTIYKRPQDIEFAIAGDTIYLLQSRPVTTVNKLSDPEGEYIAWDNSNIIESYPGLSSPLTFSFIRKMYESVYIRFSEIMGISTREIEAHKNTYANMLGLIEGRVYYNLRSWYKLLSLLPGYSLNAGFMEKMMGVKEKFELEDYVPRTKFRERLRVLNMLRIMLGNLRRLPRMRRNFTAEFEKTIREYEAIDFSICDSWKLMRLYQDFEQRLLLRWKAPLVNDFFAMIFYGTLQKLVVRYRIDEKGNLHNDLLCGARDIVSTEPVKRCRKIAEMIRKNPEVMEILSGENDERSWRKICSAGFPEIKAELEAYISDWGDRTVGELKLETISYRQQPWLLLRVIKGFLRTVENTPADQDLRMREAAEKTVNEKLRGKFFSKIIFRYFLRKSRELVSSRENLRYARTRGFGMVRRIFIAIGENFYSEALLDDPRDIFWLKQEEIFDFIQGCSESRDLRSLVALRKKEYAAYAESETAERIPTHGIVYAGNDFRPSLLPQTQNGMASLRGTGCCPGRVKARIRVVHEPHGIASLDGDILVTASTDPGWVTLFPSASAILVERGSLLSHSAIVSREMGKPCVVGISGLLQQVKTGDLVEMDGSTGEIFILDHE